MSNLLVFILIKIFLFLEATGVCAASWFLASVQKNIQGFQFDEVYVGIPKESAKMKKGNDDAKQHVEPGWMCVPTYASGLHTLSLFVKTEDA